MDLVPGERRGRRGYASETAPVGPDDLATIRYTSGTTGPPKGVAFTHAQLRWMAETMASLIPWGVRTRPARYLSFLPMNHVVEGILGTYSAYDLPAPVEITFLEDFRRVASTLPEVRPTVFFSVPRVYERVWEGLERSRAGARYLAMRDGLLRRSSGRWCAARCSGGQAWTAARS